MKKAKDLLGRTYRHFMHDSLYRNSIILLLSSVVNAFFGFIFWIICAHFYSQAQVGIATALISATGLVSSFGTLGFNNSIIRFLPKVKDKNRLLNSSYIIVALASMVAGLLFLLLLPHISSSLLIVRQRNWYMISFIAVAVAISVNIVIDNTFTAYRSTQHALIKNGLISLLKIAFLPLFLHLAGFGIFVAYGLSFFIVTLSGFGILVKRFAYKPKFVLDKKILKETARFSLANYAVTYLNGLPALLLPILIADLLGPKLNAVYYIAYTVASLLFFIPIGVGNALFAEGSNSEKELKSSIKRAAFINSLLLLPSIISILLLAPFILHFFGAQYVESGVTPLRVLALSAIFMGVAYPCGSILNVLHRLRSLIVVNLIGSFTVVILVYTAIKQGQNLKSVVIAWLGGWAAYAMLYVFAVFRAFAKTSSTTA